MINNIQLFFMIFLVVLFVYEFLIFRKYKIKKSKKNKVAQQPTEIKILTNYYGLDISKLNYNRLLNFVAVVSSLDIAIIVTISGMFENGIIQILLALLLVVPIIFLSYYFVNLYYKLKMRKGGSKNE